MKYLLVLTALFSMSVSSATVINYDDGSSYTLENNQEIYISSQKNTLYKRRIMNNKDTFFTAQDPWKKRDHVPTPTDDMTPGSHGWCVAYVPWSEGLTFDMILWQQACDTNNDGEYDEEDDRWEG